MSTSSATAHPPAQARPVVNFSLSADALLLASALIWLLWKRLVGPTVARQLQGVFAPIEEERQLTVLLTQIGAITGASRVVLAAFHNGQIDRGGFHLQKLTTVNQYTAPGAEPMPHPIRDLPIGRVMTEINMLMADPGWVTTVLDEALPQACIDHLHRNRMGRMMNRLIRVGNLPIGIVSLQYSTDERRLPRFQEPPYDEILERLVGEIGTIMRRRVVSPGRMQVLLNRVMGGGNGVRTIDG